MKLERFNTELATLLNFYKKEGFHKNPSEYEKSLYAKQLAYLLKMQIITSRLEEEIPHFDSLSKAFFKSLKAKKKPDQILIENFVMESETIRLDLSDFYIYTRMYLDTLTISIKHSFKSAGNKNWQLMENSVKCLLNKEKLSLYKKEIDYDFFEGLEKKVAWIPDFKDSRDTLMHHHSNLVLSTTREGKLGYGVVDTKDESWGRDSVKCIFEVLQNTLNDLSDLMEYLSKNLPKTP
jgi:hypothetical protein